MLDLICTVERGLGKVKIALIEEPFTQSAFLARQIIRRARESHVGVT